MCCFFSLLLYIVVGVCDTLWFFLLFILDRDKTMNFEYNRHEQENFNHYVNMNIVQDCFTFSYLLFFVFCNEPKKMTNIIYAIEVNVENGNGHE